MGSPKSFLVKTRIWIEGSFGLTPFGPASFELTPFGLTPFGLTLVGLTPFRLTPFGLTPIGLTLFSSTSRTPRTDMIQPNTITFVG